MKKFKILNKIYLLLFPVLILCLLAFLWSLFKVFNLFDFSSTSLVQEIFTLIVSFSIGLFSLFVIFRSYYLFKDDFFLTYIVKCIIKIEYEKIYEIKLFKKTNKLIIYFFNKNNEASFLNIMTGDKYYSVFIDEMKKHNTNILIDLNEDI